MAVQPWRRVPGKALLFLLNLFSAVALIFEGYNQGVFGTVSGTPGFIAMANIGYDDIVTDATKQGGLAAAYYFGAMIGCLVGGWTADKIGRKKGVAIGAVFCLLGSALMSGSVNSDMFICARIIAGIGIGFVNTIIPSWVSELSSAHNRGSNFSLVFVANYLGIVIAYWLNFGIRDSDPDFRWRFPLAFMSVPMLMVLGSTPLLPEWLIANHRRAEAIDILTKLRGDLAHDDPKLVAEIEQLDAIVENSAHKRNSYINIFLGGRYSGPLHLGRRAIMGAALQTIQQWTGILAIATWAETDPAAAEALGTAAASFAFVFLWFFTMLNIVPCWIYGSEIWPQEVRAKGYSMTIMGWAIGCGVTGFVIPIMLSRLGYGTFLFFGAMNAISAPIIYFFYPEVANKTLEEVNLLFTSDSLLVSKNMAAYHVRIQDADGNVATAARRLFDEADGYERSGVSYGDESDPEKKEVDADTREKV
ncbi:hypothetical protein B0A50_04341 [Salinomyces thailandicus]|uniref:Major facilitator superfamily (MFS) profile domain-containing protein n=1 Tax=Salinomyces thailandicus TaxID=706561 RepID=A0A4U0TYB2_9PEZI|nr:hypothetical protein B0A50_04341 [Salinomyces thailandica]